MYSDIKNRKFLFIEDRLNPTMGGVQRVSHILAEELRKIGIESYYAFCVLDSDTPSISTEVKLFFDPCLSQLQIYDIFHRYILSNNINTLVVQNIYTPLMCDVYEKLKRCLGVKIICCLHTNPDLTINKNCFQLTTFKVYCRDIIKGIYRDYIKNRSLLEKRRVYDLCDRYILLSKRYISCFQRLIDIEDLNKLRGIPNPLPFGLSDTTIVSRHKEKKLLFVGRMEESQKRISNILMLWKRISLEFPEWQLYLVGDGPDLHRYKIMAAKWNLPRIFFTGHSEDVRSYYERASLFLLTSIWEGLPMTLIEAQSMGCVPIAFDNFAAIHDIIDGNNGIIVKSNDFDSYVEMVSNLMNDGNRLCQLSSNAIYTSYANFNKDKIMEDWLNLLKDI